MFNWNIDTFYFLNWFICVYLEYWYAKLWTRKSSACEERNQLEIEIYRWRMWSKKVLITSFQWEVQWNMIGIRKCLFMSIEGLHTWVNDDDTCTKEMPFQKSKCPVKTRENVLEMITHHFGQCVTPHFLLNRIWKNTSIMQWKSVAVFFIV